MCKRWIVAGTLIVIMMSLFAAPVWADGPVNRTERAEVRFLEGMIDHHQMALDMAHDCLTKATTQIRAGYLPECDHRADPRN